MSTHNIDFYEDLTKIIFELSSNTHLNSSAAQSSSDTTSERMCWTWESNLQTPERKMRHATVNCPNWAGYSDLSLVMRNPAFCICENKDADQLRGDREADQRLCFSLHR